MSWIKDNPFVAGLAGVTVVAAGGLVFLGSHFSGKYDASLEAYRADQADVAKAEGLKTYPNAANRDAKRKALDTYRTDLTKLQESFTPFRGGELTPVAPPKFTENLKAADKQVREAFAASPSKTVLPDSFFLGFENFKGTLAPEAATGILGYQLEAVTEVFLALAKAGPKELKNVHRPVLPEESGGTFDDKEATYRALPLEITFRGSEKSVREFVNSLTASTGHYYVIRNIRIQNEKDKGPVPADAKFDTAKAGGAGADPFAGAFQLPPPADPNVPPAPGAVAEAPKPADSSRNLQQVLGGEDLNVFIRLDVLRFLPAKELTKP